MKNDDVRCVVRIYASLLEDLSYVHPSLRKELERLDRIDSIVAERGIGFFTLTLPDCCKYLERSLDAGTLMSDRPPYHGARSASDPRPRFLAGLWAQVFDERGMLLESPDVDCIFALRQLYLFAKKLRMECTDERIFETLEEFKKVENSLPPCHADTWCADVPIWLPLFGHPLWGGRSERHYREELIADLFREQPRVNSKRSTRRWDTFRELCCRISSSFGAMDYYSMRPKHGPGAVADRNSQPVNVKYDIQHWPRKLARVFPADWYASTDLVDRTISESEAPSRVICVPKTQKGPRIIASEPIAHQWMQGAVQRWLTDNLMCTALSRSIDLKDQTPNQRAALQSSLSRNQATVDLSAASDRLSTRLVEFVFQGNLDILNALHATRTRSCIMPDGELILLRKFACMGSACTFPVQSIVFAILAIFSMIETSGDFVLTTERIADLASHVRVFGDDIIVPAGSYDALSDILEDVGLKVNLTKSFAKGFFRESCGVDAYGGIDVTPAYYLQAYDARNPGSLMGVIESSNNFYKKGLWKTADCLLKTVEPGILANVRVSHWDASQPTLFTFCDGHPPELQVRWSETLHRWEARQIVSLSKVDRLDGSGNASLLQYFTEEPDPLHLYRSGESRRPKVTIGLRWVEYLPIIRKTTQRV